MAREPAHPATLEDFEAFIEQSENYDRIFELINRGIVPVPSNPYVSRIAYKIGVFIGLYLMENNLENHLLILPLSLRRTIRTCFTRQLRPYATAGSSKTMMTASPSPFQTTRSSCQRIPLVVGLAFHRIKLAIALETGLSTLTECRLLHRFESASRRARSV